MKSPLDSFRLTASALAITLALSPMAMAQQPAPGPANPAPPRAETGQPVTPPETTVVPDAPQTGEIPEAANDNQPLNAPAANVPAGVMPQSFADLVAQVSPAVVNITTSAVVSRPTQQGPAFPEGSPFGDMFRDFGFPGAPPGQQPFGAPTEQRSTALGSGFVVSADGLIVTNNHVIEGADEIEVEFYSGGRLAAKVIGTDENTDIAVLKVEAPNPLPFMAFGDSDDARVGDWVLALGNPLGQGFSATTGIVSAKSRALTGAYDDFIQTDAAINRGNSGGPLFNLKGEVIGVNTAILSPTGGSIGIGFSMASNVVSDVVDQLEEFGETRRGWLGVMIQDLSPEIADSLGRDNETGALVTDVPDGPAQDGGIEPGDVIVRFEGQEVADSRDLTRRVANAPVGEAVTLTVIRDGRERDLDVTLGRREDAEADAAGTDRPGAGAETSPENVLGLSVTPLTPELAQSLDAPESMKGLVIEAVDPASVASERGLNAGDIITEAGQQPVESLRDLSARIEEAKEAGRNSVLLLIRRGGDPRFVALPIDEAAD